MVNEYPLVRREGNKMIQIGERSRYMRVWRQLLPIWALYIPFLIWYLSIPIDSPLPPIAPQQMYRLVVLGMLLLFLASVLWNANAVGKILRDGESIRRYGIGAGFHTIILFSWTYFWAMLATQVFPEIARDQIWKTLQFVVQMWLFGGVIFFFLAIRQKMRLLDQIQPSMYYTTSNRFTQRTVLSLFVRFSCAIIFVIFTILKPFWLEGLVLLLLADFVKELYRF